MARPNLTFDCHDPRVDLSLHDGASSRERAIGWVPGDEIFMEPAFRVRLIRMEVPNAGKEFVRSVGASLRDMAPASADFPTSMWDLLSAIERSEHEQILRPQADASAATQNVSELATSLCALVRRLRRATNRLRAGYDLKVTCHRSWQQPTPGQPRSTATAASLFCSHDARGRI